LLVFWVLDSSGVFEGSAGYSISLAAAWIISTALALAVFRRWAPVSLRSAVFVSRRPRLAGFFGSIWLSAVTAMALWPVLGLVMRVFSISWHFAEAGTAGRLATAVGFALVLLIGPVCEEILFRGVLLGACAGRYGPRRAIAFSGLVFALAHLPWQWPTTLIMSCVVAWWVLHTRVLFYGIAYHITWNVLADLLPTNPAELDGWSAWASFSMGTLALILSILWIRRSGFESGTIEDSAVHRTCLPETSVEERT